MTLPASQHARRERFQRVLSETPLEWHHPDNLPAPQLRELDEEGTHTNFGVLPEALCGTLDRVKDDGDALLILASIADIARKMERKGWDRGFTAAKAHGIEQFHEMIGINKIVEAIQAIGRAP